MAPRNEVVDEPLDHECRHESQGRIDQAEEHRLHKPPLCPPAVAQDPREPVGRGRKVELCTGLEEKHSALLPDSLKLAALEVN